MSNFSKINWTNQSVLNFAKNEDPVKKIIFETRELVFKAKERGWSGPPFNPIEIARMLDLSLEANANLADARLIISDCKPTIQFNPTQPRERMRFSIAHEIAHRLFPDWHERERHRGGDGEATDTWQLELLCNLAAAEIILPIGSIEDNKNSIPTIEELMIKRKTFDVSAEAFLIRLINFTLEPVGLFIASAEHGHTNRTYSINYFLSSLSAPDFKPLKLKIPSSSVVYQCTAIGHTVKAKEDWFNTHPCIVECVGLPPYPKSVYPRVAGLIRLDNSNFSITSGIIKLHGDILSPKGDGTKLICQLVNNKATRWGGGIAKKIASKFPEAEESFRKTIFKIPEEQRLGQVIFSEAKDDLAIASLIAQHGFGPSAHPRIRYSHLHKCFERVASESLNRNASIHMPKLGTGAAGGDWPTIEEIINETIIRKGLTVTLYEPPPKREQMELFK